ncbi:hypothetical protein REPUB_Repub12eG0119900 [Reevesia pubescens]
MRGQATCTALLHTYVKNKLSAKAESLFEKMTECGFVRYTLPYNHTLSLYISEGQLEKVPEIIENASPDNFTCNLLSVSASQNNIAAAGKIFVELEKAKTKPDWVKYIALINVYIEGKELEKATSTLKEMEKKASQFAYKHGG